MLSFSHYLDGRPRKSPRGLPEKFEARKVSLRITSESRACRCRVKGRVN
jgi:hypothetical protein